MEEFQLNSESLQKIQGGTIAQTSGQLLNQGNTWCSGDYGSIELQQIIAYYGCCDLNASGNCL